MEDGQDRPVPADESTDLEDVVASLEEPEQPALEVGGDAKLGMNEPPADDVRVADGPTSELDAPVVAEDLGAGPEVAEPEVVDPQLAALQADLESQSDDVEPDASQGSSEPAADDAPDEEAATAVGGADEASEDSKEIELPNDRPGVPVWPFLTYFAIWVIFAGMLVWRFMQAPAGTPVYELDMYGASVLVGLVLTVLGPVLAIGVWLVSWISRPAARTGLFSRSLIIGAVTTLAGVALWLVALGAVDMLRLGRLL
jgi:hypothetical protein